MREWQRSDGMPDATYTLQVVRAIQVGGGAARLDAPARLGRVFDSRTPTACQIENESPGLQPGANVGLVEET